MKRSLIVFFALVLSATFSCQDQKDLPAKTVPKDVVSRLKAAGFDTSEGLFPYKDGYIVEYDIFLTDKMIDDLASSNAPKGNQRVEHYRTNNLVSGLPRAIRVYIDPGFDTYIQSAFDVALARYNALNLSLTFQRATASTGADISIFSFYEVSNILGYSAGFPSGGNPASPIRLNTYYYNSSAQRADAATVIAHEIGHAIGFRHTDYMNRTFSCGSGGNEGDAGVGAVQIPGTPSGPSANSWMLACSNNTDRPFTSEDITSLTTIYPNFAINSGAEWLNGPFNYSAYQFHLSDVNGDGKADIVGINTSDERSVVWLSRGDGFYSGAEWVNGPFNYSAYVFNVADVNGDGKADIVGVNASDERSVVWLSRGDGFYSGSEWLNGPFNYSGYQFHVADVNGDGKADITGINASDERAVVWLSRGDGFYSGAEWANGPFNYSSYQFHVADINGDGKADITGINPSDERAVVWLSRGDGFYSGAEWLNGPFNYSGYVFNLADINADGMADIVGVKASDERVVAWTSAGNGFNGGVEWFNGPFNYSGYIFKVAPVNGDAKADVVGIYPNDERAVVWTIK